MTLSSLTHFPTSSPPHFLISLLSRSLSLAPLPPPPPTDDINLRNGREVTTWKLYNVWQMWTSGCTAFVGLFVCTLIFSLWIIPSLPTDRHVPVDVIQKSDVMEIGVKDAPQANWVASLAKYGVQYDTTQAYWVIMRVFFDDANGRQQAMWTSKSFGVNPAAAEAAANEYRASHPFDSSIVVYHNRYR